jgi:hypothetical protein
MNSRITSASSGSRIYSVTRSLILLWQPREMGRFPNLVGELPIRQSAKTAARQSSVRDFADTWREIPLA